MQLASAAQEAVWMRELVHDLTGQQSDTTLIFDGNQFAISTAKNPIFL